MVMPRLSSSEWVSVHFPVSARVREVFPWSTCPTIPMFTSACNRTTRQLALSSINLLLLLFLLLACRFREQFLKRLCSGLRNFRVHLHYLVGNDIAAHVPFCAPSLAAPAVAGPPGKDHAHPARA